MPSRQLEARLRAGRASRMLDELNAGTEFELMSGWHCLRHSFISLCVAKGIDWPQIAEWVLGSSADFVSSKRCRVYWVETARRKNLWVNGALNSIDFCYPLDCQNGFLGGLIKPCGDSGTADDELLVD